MHRAVISVSQAVKLSNYVGFATGMRPSISSTGLKTTVAWETAALQPNKLDETSLVREDTKVH